MGWSLAMGTLWTLTGQWVSIYCCAWSSVPAGEWDGDHQCEMRSIQNVTAVYTFHAAASTTYHSRSGHSRAGLYST